MCRQREREKPSTVSLTGLWLSSWSNGAAAHGAVLSVGTTKPFAHSKRREEREKLREELLSKMGPGLDDSGNSQPEDSRLQKMLKFGSH